MRPTLPPRRHNAPTLSPQTSCTHPRALAHTQEKQRRNKHQHACTHTTHANARTHIRTALSKRTARLSPALLHLSISVANRTTQPMRSSWHPSRPDWTCFAASDSRRRAALELLSARKSKNTQGSFADAHYDCPTARCKPTLRNCCCPWSLCSVQQSQVRSSAISAGLLPGPRPLFVPKHGDRLVGRKRAPSVGRQPVSHQTPAASPNAQRLALTPAPTTPRALLYRSLTQ